MRTVRRGMIGDVDADIDVDVNDVIGAGTFGSAQCELQDAGRGHVERHRRQIVNSSRNNSRLTAQRRCSTRHYHLASVVHHHPVPIMFPIIHSLYVLNVNVCKFMLKNGRKL